MTDNWELMQIRDWGRIDAGRQRSFRITLGKMRPYLRVANVFDGFIDISDVLQMPFSDTEFAKFKLISGDILLNEGQSLELVGRSAIYQGNPPDCAFQNTLVRFRPGPKCDVNFAQLLFQYLQYTGRLSAIAKQTTSIAHLGVNRFADLWIKVPSIEEQRRIADVITKWDSVIALTEKLIAAKRRFKQGLIQKSLSHPFWTKNFECPETNVKKWCYESFDSCFVERYETSHNLDEYPLFSLTIEDGIVEKTERYNREFLLKNREKNQYRIVHPGDFVFNPMNLRFGAIAVSDIPYPVAVSAYYNVLILNEAKIHRNFAFEILRSNRMLHLYNSIGKGSLVEKKRVHLSDFLKIKVPLPSLEEQEKISDVMLLISKEAALLNRKLTLLQKQKRGLMQKLLTGDIPISIPNHAA